MSHEPDPDQTTDSTPRYSASLTGQAKERIEALIADPKRPGIETATHAVQHLIRQADRQDPVAEDVDRMWSIHHGLEQHVPKDAYGAAEVILELYAQVVNGFVDQPARVTMKIGELRKALRDAKEDETSYEIDASEGLWRND